MDNERERIDVGTSGAWNPKGLKLLDDEVSRLAEHHAATNQGARALRWFLLDTVTDEPVPAPFDDFEKMLQNAERSWWSLFDTQRRSRKGHLSDREVGYLLGHETDAPVIRRKWKNLREQVFSKIGMSFGAAPSTIGEKATTFDIGSEGSWRYDVIRVLDEKLVELCEHHAATHVGAETLRWHIWDELTYKPRQFSLMDVQEQLENAEESLMASLSADARRAKGHLNDESVARMLGFRTSRPIVEGYFCHLRENVFLRIAEGFGVVGTPWEYHTADDIDIGRQGAWDKESFERLDETIRAIVAKNSKTDAGAEALRWFFLDEVTSDPEPVNAVYIEQRLKKRAGSMAELFAAVHKRTRPALSDAKIARFVGLPDPEAISKGEWRRFRKRVLERVDFLAE